MIVCGSALLLGGCSVFSPDGGMQPVMKFASAELGKEVAAIRSEDNARAARGTVERLLKRQLTANAAVQIALLNNRGLQAAYNELGYRRGRHGWRKPAAQSDHLAVADSRLRRN